jgi:anti-sigma regulatory factor (Ser/Thr protein kinase)
LALTLKYPKRQSIAFSTKLFHLYKEALDSTEDEIIFDLSNSEALSPFGVVMLTTTIDACARKGRKRKYVDSKNRKLKKFLKEIGFYDFFHLDSGIAVKDWIKTETVQLRLCEGVDYQIIERIIYLFNNHLNLSRYVKESLQMSLQEIMTNVVDHSRKNKYLICAYADKPNKKIRLCITDVGIGIFNSLKNSTKYDYISNDYEAIKEATKEGVSSRPGRAGLGLNHIKNFIKINEGQMCILSGEGKVFWKYDHGQILNQKMPIPFPGTVVKLIINIDKEGFYFLSSEKDYLF